MEKNKKLVVRELSTATDSQLVVGAAPSLPALGVIGETSVVMHMRQDTAPMRAFLLSEVLEFVH